MNTFPDAAPAGKPNHTAMPREARHPEHFLDRYPCRVVFVFVFAVVMWIIFTSVVGISVSCPTILMFVSLSAVGAVRRAHDLPAAQVVTVVAGVCLYLAAWLVGGADLRIGSGVAITLSLGLSATLFVLRRRERRQARRPMRAWLSLPHGQDIPLDVRPFRCGRCDRVHHVAFAEDQSRPLSSFVTVLVEGIRGDVLLAIVPDADGVQTLATAPADFPKLVV